MKKYRVTAYDVYIQEFAVLAESEKEALEKFKKGKGTLIGSGEYFETLDDGELGFERTVEEDTEYKETDNEFSGIDGKETLS